MLMLNDVKEELLPVEMESEHGLLEEKLSHLGRDLAMKIIEISRATKIAASSLPDPGPADVPVEHLFSLTDEQRIYHSTRKMAPKHNTIVCKNMNLILKARLITSATPAWSFLIVTATKQGSNTSFCVHYRTLN